MLSLSGKNKNSNTTDIETDLSIAFCLLFYDTMSRNSGSRVVIVMASGIIATLGVGTIWLPFVADKDKVRGLHEESDGGMDERSRREYEAMLRQMNGGPATDAGAAAAAAAQEDAPPPPPARQSNSMWSRLKRSNN